MFFNKQKKIAFILPTKCGTFALRDFFPQIPHWHTAGVIHDCLDTTAKKYPNLNNYTIYAFFRNPLLRFESAVRHAYRVKNLSFNSYDEFIDRFEEMNSVYEIIIKPQSYWTADPRVTPLDFDSLESELHRVTGTTIPVRQLNAAGDSWRSEITDKVRAFVREYYAADYALAKDRLGKTYEG